MTKSKIALEQALKEVAKEYDFQVVIEVYLDDSSIEAEDIGSPNKGETYINFYKNGKFQGSSSIPTAKIGIEKSQLNKHSFFRAKFYNRIKAAGFTV